MTRTNLRPLASLSAPFAGIIALAAISGCGTPRFAGKGATANPSATTAAAAAANAKGSKARRPTLAAPSGKIALAVAGTTASDSSATEKESTLTSAVAGTTTQLVTSTKSFLSSTGNALQTASAWIKSHMPALDPVMTFLAKPAVKLGLIGFAAMALLAFGIRRYGRRALASVRSLRMPSLRMPSLRMPSLRMPTFVRSMASSLVGRITPRQWARAFAQGAMYLPRRGVSLMASAGAAIRVRFQKPQKSAEAAPAPAIEVVDQSTSEATIEVVDQSAGAEPAPATQPQDTAGRAWIAGPRVANGDHGLAAEPLSPSGAGWATFGRRRVAVIATDSIDAGTAIEVVALEGEQVRVRSSN